MGAKRLATTAIALLLVSQQASAATAPGEEKLIGNFTDWQAMSYDDDGKVCSLWTNPKPAGRREAHAFVAHRPAAQSFHEVSIRFAVPLKKDSTVSAVIGRQRFTMYVDGDSAWNPSIAEDQRMVQAMRAGAILTVTGTTATGETVRDTYSLSGFTAAHQSASRACNAN